MDKLDLCSFVLTLAPDVQLQNVYHDITATLPLQTCSSVAQPIPQVPPLSLLITSNLSVANRMEGEEDEECCHL